MLGDQRHGPFRLLAQADVFPAASVLRVGSVRHAVIAVFIGSGYSYKRDSKRRFQV